MGVLGLLLHDIQGHVIRKERLGNSLVVQWLGLRTFTAKVVGSIPGQGTKIPQAARCNQKNFFNLKKKKRKEKKRC